jgi:hypothetical protein
MIGQDDRTVCVPPHVERAERLGIDYASGSFGSPLLPRQPLFLLLLGGFNFPLVPSF